MVFPLVFLLPSPQLFYAGNASRTARRFDSEQAKSFNFWFLGSDFCVTLGKGLNLFVVSFLMNIWN